MRRQNTIGRTTASGLPAVRWLQIALIAFVQYFDPFSIVSGTSRISEDIANRMFSIWYAEPSGTPDVRVRDRITVVLLTDRDAERIYAAGGYPIPLRDHGEIIRTILCKGPAAVFVDFSFRWERIEGDAALFDEALRHRRRGGECVGDAAPAAGDPPVFVAHVPSETSACDPMGETSAETCDARRQLEPVRNAVQTVAMPGTGDMRRYVLYDASLSAGAKAGTSPALELYRHVCRADPGFAPGCRDIAAVPVETGEGRPSLGVRWGLHTRQPGSTSAAKAGAVAGCPERQSGPATWSDTFRQLVTEAIPMLAPQPQLGGAGWCPYHPTLDYSTLSRLSVDDPERLRSLIEGRIVIYGGSITAVNDVVPSPVLGLQPGAHFHAMALDNLLTLGAAYWRDPPELQSRGLEFLLSVVAIWLGWRFEKSQASGSTAQASLLSVSYLLSIWILLAGVIGAVYLMGWAPLNWTGLFAVSLLGMPPILPERD